MSQPISSVSNAITAQITAYEKDPSKPSPTSPSASQTPSSAPLEDTISLSPAGLAMLNGHC